MTDGRSSERDGVMAWGDEERCDFCGEVWVEPSKNSMVKDYGGMHNFMRSYGIRRQPGGYEEANLLIDQFIAQDRRNFKREHQNCRYRSSERDEERCEVCGEAWVEPSKNSIKKSFGGMHNFMRTYGLMLQPGRYEQANLIIEKMIAQDKEKFIREHQYCRPSSPSSSSSEYW